MFLNLFKSWMVYSFSFHDRRLYEKSKTVFYCFRISRTPETSKIKLLLSLVKRLHSLTNVTKNSILDAAGDLDPPLWKKKIQWNLLIADILYSGHLSAADTFLGNGWNPGQTLITKPLCSGHFIADAIWRSQLNFSPIMDLHIADRPKYWSNKTYFSFLKTFLFNLFQTTIYILR